MRARFPARWHDDEVGSKRERQADRALVAAYHEARLGELVEHVAGAVDRFRAGEHDAYVGYSQDKPKRCNRTR